MRFAVIHEADADFRIATELADRMLMDAIDWLDEDLLTNQREWLAELPTGQHLKWKGIKKLARDAGVRSHGHFDGDPGAADASAARRAIDYLRMADPDLKAILLIRDQDDQPDRKFGLEQARHNDRSGITIVIGLAIVERECWVLSGFVPDGETEMERFKELRQSLGFDPAVQSHELVACKLDSAPRSSKRVLRILTNGELQRERKCWTETPLDLLLLRGVENGLTSFLLEVKLRLASQIGHVH